jgi:hypothetical protein
MVLNGLNVYRRNFGELCVLTCPLEQFQCCHRGYERFSVSSSHWKLFRLDKKPSTLTL